METTTTKWFTVHGTEYTGKVHSFNEKKGTAKYETPWLCGRCGGQGGAAHWQFTGWTCYECGGHGFRNRTRSVTVYTEAAYTKMDAARTKRNNKKIAKAQAAAAAREAERKAQFAGKLAEFNAAFPLFTERLAQYVEQNEFLKDLYTKLTEVYGSLSENQVNAAIRSMDKIDVSRASQWVGAIGQRMEFELTVERVYIPETVGWQRIPPSWSFYCRDAKGNKVVYRGRANCMPNTGETAKIMATVKDHTDYQGTKQTLIERPKEVPQAPQALVIAEANSIIAQAGA